MTRAPKPASRRGAVHSVRIVAGRLRGSKIPVADVPGLRPTPDRVRETLFNWLAPTIDGMRCLDLYAGTGALGIEALSRGAGDCVFVERDHGLCRALVDTLLRLQVSTAEVWHSTAEDFLRDHAARPFDLVFLDPPFADQRWSAIAEALEQDGWLADGAFVYVESPKSEPVALPACWQPHRQGSAGAVTFALVRRPRRDPLS